MPAFVPIPADNIDFRICQAYEQRPGTFLVAYRYDITSTTFRFVSIVTRSQRKAIKHAKAFALANLATVLFIGEGFEQYFYVK